MATYTEQALPVQRAPVCMLMAVVKGASLLSCHFREAPALGKPRAWQ
jgi:hypothetical protein